MIDSKNCKVWLNQVWLNNFRHKNDPALLNIIKRKMMPRRRDVGNEDNLHDADFKIWIKCPKSNRDKDDIMSLFRSLDNMNCHQIVMTDCEDIVLVFKSRGYYERCVREVEKYDYHGLIDSLIKLKSDGNCFDTVQYSKSDFMDLLKSSSQKSENVSPRMKPNHEIVMRCKMNKCQIAKVYKIMKEINGISCTFAYKDEHANIVYTFKSSSAFLKAKNDITKVVKDQKWDLIKKHIIMMTSRRNIRDYSQSSSKRSPSNCDESSEFTRSDIIKSSKRSLKTLESQASKILVHKDQLAPV